MGYFDANNLYGYAQCQPMPVKKFQWVSEEEISKMTVESILSMTNDQETGFIFEVDLYYPKKLHKAHSSFPLAPEHLNISQNDLSPYAKKCRHILTKKKTYKSKKLCATFNERKNYVVHYRNLQTYLKLGMKIKKIHKILSFDQEAFLKKYIDTCTLLRKNSKTDFGKRLWKLFANSVFGKFIESTRNYLNVKFAHNEKAAERYISQPNFNSFKIISEDLVIIFQKQAAVYLNKAYPIGFTILERAKDFMFTEYYTKIKPILNKSGCDVWVLMSDTDSLCLALKSNDSSFDCVKKINKMIDFSNYSPTSAQFSNKHESKLGYWKDELKGAKMTEFTGLRSKTYAFKVENKDFQSKCKGVSKAYRKTIQYDSFKKCLQAITEHSIKQVNIRSKSHIVQTLELEKLCFSSFDDKRYLFDCGVHSVPYGSCLISKNNPGVCYFCMR